MSTLRGNSAAVLALGSNLPPRNHWLDLALAQLGAEEVQLVAATSRWHTAAIGSVPQPDFLNQLVLVEAARQGLDWLALAQTLEVRAGRRRAIPQGPRTLDVDVILLGGQVWASAELTVPHPALLERPYLLRGVADLVPDWLLPGDGRALATVARDVLVGSWADLHPRTAARD
ncbi:MAG: 2-amino-4-hydroxy-6-hydroxymethyldihydropteridine diphosphokinase [Candidatus Dormiibacterota bacterium]